MAKAKFDNFYKPSERIDTAARARVHKDFKILKNE